MGTSPTSYINSPSASVIYFGKVWAGCVVAGSDLVTANGRVYTGANGTGSLTTVTGLEIWLVDWQTAGNVGHFGPGGPFNSISCQHTATGGENGHYFYVAIRYTGGGSPGSIGLYVDFNTSAFFWPGTPTFVPSVGGPGTAVAISGSRFTDATGVTFNGVADSGFVVNSDTSISAHVPTGATYGPIHVINPVGDVASAGNFTPSTFRVDDGAAWQTASLVHGDDGAAWQICKVWVDDGSQWVQIA